MDIYLLNLECTSIPVTISKNTVSSWVQTPTSATLLLYTIHILAWLWPFKQIPSKIVNVWRENQRSQHHFYFPVWAEPHRIKQSTLLQFQQVRLSRAPSGSYLMPTIFAVQGNFCAGPKSVWIILFRVRWHLTMPSSTINLGAYHEQANTWQILHFSAIV